MTPMSTSDIYPTLLAAADIAQPDVQPELDGIDMLPYLSGEESQRPEPIAFQSPMRGVEYDADSKQLQYALSDNRFKLYSGDSGETWALYDLLVDPAESVDVAERHPAVLASMREQLMSWVRNTQEDARSQ